MTNPNLDETLPTPIHPHSEEPQSETPAPESSLPEGERGSFDETKPTPAPLPEGGVVEPPPPGSDPEPVRRRNAPTWLLLSVVGVFTLLLIAGMSAYGGYRSGDFTFQSSIATNNAAQLDEQFALGVQDLQAGRFELARQRFEWLIRQDPNYPGAIDMLADAQLVIITTATATLVPTPTLTPTPDMRGVEELYVAAQMAMAANDWDTAISTLLKLRKLSPEYQAIDVDGMLYVSLRNRGVDKIKNADLEGGTYDLALAERFGPVDAEAKNYRTWAELYITGASFWEVDWGQAVSYFKELQIVAPYLRDASGWTSMDRYRRALVGYGDWFASHGDMCAALEQYQLAMDLNPEPDIEPTAVYAGEECSSGGSDDDTGEGGDDIPQPLNTDVPPLETDLPTNPPPEETPVPENTPEP